MKFVYYEFETGMIKIISPIKEPSSTDPYVEVEDEEVAGILDGSVNILEVFVKPKEKTSKLGRILTKSNENTIWKTIDDWMYLIPKTAGDKVEFKIDQHIGTKTIAITLSDYAKDWWKDNSFFQKKEIMLSACRGSDPHNIIWWKSIKCEDLLEGVFIDYEGTDDIRFYTHRFFEYYYHEQHT